MGSEMCIRDRSGAAVLAEPDMAMLVKAARNSAEADRFAHSFVERLVTVLFVAFEIRCFCCLIELY